MVIFISNFVSPHTIPFSEELYNILGENFLFIETRQMTAERSSLGYDKLRSKPFVVSYKRFNLEKKKYQDLIGAADTVLASYGSIDTALLEGRIANDKQTFLLSERLFKKKLGLIDTMKAYRRVYKNHTRFNSKPLYTLCSSSYAAYDFNLFGAYKNKTYKWAYFPTTKHYDIDKLIGMNYQIKYEKPLEQKDLNYPNYHLFRLVLSIEPLPQINRVDDIIYNPKTDVWEMNGMQFVNYEDALEYVDEVIK